MTPQQLRRRSALLGRMDAAIDRWPERLGPEFVRELTSVADGLVTLAKASDRDGGAPLERVRTWRYVGNACFHLGNGGRLAELQQSAQAFERAETLLAEAPDPVETLKVHWGLGKTLLLLSNAKDVRLAVQARDRLAAALALAPTHLPEAASYVQQSVADAERVIALLTSAEGLRSQIDRLAGELRAPQPSPEPDVPASAADMLALFGVLQQEFDKDKPNLDPTRRVALEGVMGRLGDLVRQDTDEGERSLLDMIGERGKLDGLIRELAPQGRRPSLKGPGAPAGSRSERILAALQDLKMFVFSSHGQPGGTAPSRSGRPGAERGMRAIALDLFPRIAKLTTRISQAGADTAVVRTLERDEARGLASEVRRYARLPHAMLAQPVWGRYSGLVDVNRIFFSGPLQTRQAMTDAAAVLGLELDRPGRAGADVAEHRWQDLRAAGVAVFDLHGADPHVHYELGLALALGTPLLLIASEGTRIAFDIAQNVRFYTPGNDLAAFLADEIDGVMYGVPMRAGGSSLHTTLHFVDRLAAGDTDNALLRVAAQTLREAGGDASRFHDALTAFIGYVKGTGMEVILPPWPASYPDDAKPRLFAVMPFRAEHEAAYASVAAAARKAGIEAVRGDVAEGQQIVTSIWDEICRAAYVTVNLSGFNPNVCLELGLAHALGRPVFLFGREGTERELADALPVVAKWRCHTYRVGRKAQSALAAALAQFLATKE